MGDRGSPILSCGLPIAKWPDARLPTQYPARRASLADRYPPREPRLDRHPSRALIGIAFGQRPDAVQVLG
jgi:hypothetical protein